MVVDEEGVQKNTTFFASQKGPHVIVVCGGTGEIGSLSPEEVATVVGNASPHKGDTMLVSGVRGNTEWAVQMARSVENAGADVVLVMPEPAVVEQGEDRLYAHHAAIAEAIGIGVMPFRNNTSMLSVDLVKRLAEFPNVVALKDESGDLDLFRKTVVATEGQLPCIMGGEMLAPYYFLAGAKGVTTGVSNLLPHLSIALCEAGLTGDYEKAQEIRDILVPITELRGRAGNTMLKGGLELLGLAGGPIRDTGAIITDEHREELRAILRGFGVL
jgi:5-dehydro-4-deoxyglucarate dehydratase